MQLPELVVLQKSHKFLSSCRFKTCVVLQFTCLGFQHDYQDLYCLIVSLEAAAPILNYRKEVILATYYAKTDKR